ncbi:MAG: hypothetical protein JNK67_28890 [Alphaproteobacteria bacterium]|nr:hypothetical protein [Alphaproteobacteria bacterium]
MVDVPDRPDVAVRLVPLEFRFRHGLVFLSCLLILTSLWACARLIFPKHLVPEASRPDAANIDAAATDAANMDAAANMERVMGIEPT